MRVLEEGRLSQGARSIGVARRLIELCRAHTQIRVQFGKAIAEFQMAASALSERLIVFPTI